MDNYREACVNVLSRGAEITVELLDELTTVREENAKLRDDMNNSKLFLSKF